MLLGSVINVLCQSQKLCPPAGAILWAESFSALVANMNAQNNDSMLLAAVSLWHDSVNHAGCLREGACVQPELYDVFAPSTQRGSGSDARFMT